MKRVLSAALLLLLGACAVQVTPLATGVPPATNPPQPTVTSTLPITPTSAPLPFPASELAAAILNPQGNVTPVHDPVLIKQGDTYYLFSTGPRIPIRCSRDLLNWEYCQSGLDRLPTWLKDAVPAVADVWAPDISFYAGTYHLYYSGSSFGSNRSAIGLLTNETLDANDPRYAWQDRGLVMDSKPGNNYNAIDPNLALDREGEPWLAFGSFWSGIQLIKIDPATGKPPPGAKIYPLANKPGNDAIEGSFIVRRGEFYYLFVSHDFCCKGVSSTYKIKVGRAAEITGPYLDRDGKPMLGGGGTLVYAGSDRWRGPGHNAILIQDNTYYLVYHAYDRDLAGRPTLRIEKLFWDAEGWTLSPSALLGQ